MASFSSRWGVEFGAAAGAAPGALLRAGVFSMSRLSVAA
jgi:hypothetical protein